MSRLTLVCCLFATSVAWAEAPGLAWTFGAGPLNWQPREKTIKLDVRAGQGATATSPGCLHLAGTMRGGYNYVASDSRPLTAGQLYRLTVLLRVDELGPTTPAPYFKIEFVPANGAELGRVNSGAYDLRHLHTWQELEIEFRAPPNTARCWVALEKGTDRAASIDASIDQVRIVPISSLKSREQNRLNPLPAPLAAKRGMHPRLFLDAARVAKLRAGLAGDYAALWTRLRQETDSRYCNPKRAWPPTFRADDGQSGEEQLWQREVGNAMPYLALCWLLSGDRQYLDVAQATALASCGYPTWGAGQRDGLDLAAGHQLLGLAIVYDWCGDQLAPAAKATIRATLVKRASTMFERAAEGQVWWQRAYLQNHLWVNVCGLAAAGLALCDEVDDANLWVGLPLRKFRQTMTCLGPDGASHEGVGYWQYGVEYLLKFMTLAHDLLGEDLFAGLGAEWWRQTGLYPLYLSVPRNAWTSRSSLVDIADCPRSNWYGPEYLLRELARRYRDGHAQWLAAECERRKTAVGGAGWLNLIWYDPALAETPPTDLPTMHHFSDLGLVSCRSDWSGGESLVVLKCGPPLGHRALKESNEDYGSGHVHPDANHFVVFGGGEWLVCDDGYADKRTAQHNTLLVGGKGQLGEEGTWFDGSVYARTKAEPRVLAATSSPGLDQLTADATPAYPATAGLRRYVRRLLFVKPNALLVLDDVACEAPRELELRFHTEREVQALPDGGFGARGDQARLRLEPLTRDGVTAAAGKLTAPGQTHAGHALVQNTVTLKTTRAAWRCATAITWAVGAEPARVTLGRDGDRWTFRVGGRTVVFDWATGQSSDG